MVVIQDLRPITKRSNGTRKESDIKNIARHHSATTGGDFHTFWKHWNGVKGWGTGGYHEIIMRDGSVQLCYDPNEITNGIANHNSTTYHICVVGNGSFTDAQERTWEERALLAMKRFGLSVKDVKGHKEFTGANTACPGVDMGTVRNRLTYLLGKELIIKENATVASKSYRLTTGTFKNKKEADKAAADLKKAFGWVVYVKEA